MAEQVSPKSIAEAFLEGSAGQGVDVTGLRRQLEPLADQVDLDTFDVSEGAIKLGADGAFRGEATAYVLLRNQGASAIGEEVPIHFRGTVDADGRPRFEGIEADLSPFAE